MYSCIMQWISIPMSKWETILISCSINYSTKFQSIFSCQLHLSSKNFIKPFFLCHTFLLLVQTIFTVLDQLYEQFQATSQASAFYWGLSWTDLPNLQIKNQVTYKYQKCLQQQFHIVSVYVIQTWNVLSKIKLLMSSLQQNLISILILWFD